MAKYGSKKTAYNGVANYIINFDVPKEKKNVLGFKDVNAVMEKFIETMKPKAFKSMEMNAAFIQNNFTKFAQFMRDNYKEK